MSTGNINHPLSKFVRAVQMVQFMLRNHISSDDLYQLAQAALQKQIRMRSTHSATTRQTITTC